LYPLSCAGLRQHKKAEEQVLSSFNRKPILFLDRALVQGQKIVVPVSIGMRAHVCRPAGGAHNAYF
jgi:hypothetical protein